MENKDPNSKEKVVNFLSEENGAMIYFEMPNNTLKSTSTLLSHDDRKLWLSP